MKDSTVSVVLTSCGRLDLLEQTIDSFFSINTYPITQFILIDDSGKDDLLPKLNQLIKKYKLPIELIFNQKNLGQIKSIDIAYEKVTSEYIFHCEDDWSFYKSGFIEDSLNILKEDDSVINVWLRAHSDTNGHPINYSIKKMTSSGFGYYYMETSYLGNWHGFVFNPSLKRVIDCRRFMPFSHLKVLAPKGKGQKLIIGEEDLSIYLGTLPITRRYLRRSRGLRCLVNQLDHC
jgi:hypothetical protein